MRFSNIRKRSSCSEGSDCYLCTAGFWMHIWELSSKYDIIHVRKLNC